MSVNQMSQLDKSLIAKAREMSLAQDLMARLVKPEELVAELSKINPQATAGLTTILADPTLKGEFDNNPVFRQYILESARVDSSFLTDENKRSTFMTEMKGAIQTAAQKRDEEKNNPQAAEKNYVLFQKEKEDKQEKQDLIGALMLRGKGVLGGYGTRAMVTSSIDVLNMFADNLGVAGGVLKMLYGTGMDIGGMVSGIFSSEKGNASAGVIEGGIEKLLTGTQDGAEPAQPVDESQKVIENAIRGLNQRGNG
ncbi:MAG: hypothetical protein IKJ28_05150 [Alphaproteobacteria bacterium]|nr:hypothetical protein [Alphaproteobacteria bacterium]